MSRTSERGSFQPDVRVQLLEHDADEFDGALEGLRLELKGMRGLLTGILVSVATAAILLAVNIGVSVAK